VAALSCANAEVMNLLKNNYGSPGDQILELEKQILTQGREKRQLQQQVVQLISLNRFAQEVMRHLTIQQVIASAHEQIRSILSPDWVVSYLCRGGLLIYQDPGQHAYPVKIVTPAKI
jgi:hypothetical protein